MRLKAGPGGVFGILMLVLKARSIVADNGCIQVRSLERTFLVCGINQISRKFFKATLVADQFLRKSMANTYKERGKLIATRSVNEQKDSTAIIAKICQMVRDFRNAPIKRQRMDYLLETRADECYNRSFGGLCTQAPAPRHEALFLALLNTADCTRYVSTPRFAAHTLGQKSDLEQTSTRQSTGVVETSFHTQSWLGTMFESKLYPSRNNFLKPVGKGSPALRFEI
jgi:hypothetical protein